MKESIFNLLSKAEFIFGKVKVSSILNSMLWVCFFISLPSFYFSVSSTGIWKCMYFGIAILPILITCFTYIYFVWKNPDYLRSESFQIQKRTLEYLGEKGKEFAASADHLISIANPKAIEHKDE
jgi:hypothetical protein